MMIRNGNKKKNALRKVRMVVNWERRNALGNVLAFICLNLGQSLPAQGQGIVVAKGWVQHGVVTIQASVPRIVASTGRTRYLQLLLN